MGAIRTQPDVGPARGRENPPGTRRMPDDPRDPRSVTAWVGDLKRGGGGDAARQLWDRYFERLVSLARARMRGKPSGLADEEDVALSAFDSFCRRAEGGQFPALGGRDDLWRLLVTITARKTNALVHHERRLKRGGGKVLDEAAFAGDAADLGMAAIAGREPDPGFTAEASDELARLLALLGDDTLRQIAMLRMEGLSNEEIAARMGAGLRSVERKLGLIRAAWENESR
jgi:DNA-directed RNA polymerase specialized sigma24 family protein